MALYMEDFISFHLLDLYLVRFYSFPAFSLIFQHFDIKNLHDEKYLYLFLGSGVGGLGVCGPGSWGLGSWGLGVQRIEHANLYWLVITNSCC